MHMIGHNHIAIDIMPVAFKVIKPAINNIVAIYFLNQRKPIMTSECYKKSAEGKWYRLLDGHDLKVRCNTQRPLRETLLGSSLEI